MNSRLNSTTNSAEQTNQSRKNENLKQRKSSQQNLKNSLNNRDSSYNTALNNGQSVGYKNAESPSNSEVSKF